MHPVLYIYINISHAKQYCKLVYNFLQAGSKTDLMFSDKPTDMTG